MTMLICVQSGADMYDTNKKSWEQPCITTWNIIKNPHSPKTRSMTARFPKPNQSKTGLDKYHH